MILFSSDTLAPREHLAWQLDLDRGRETLLLQARELTPGYFGQFAWGTAGSSAGTLLLAGSLFRAVFGRLPDVNEATTLLAHVQRFREFGWSVFDYQIKSWVYAAQVKETK